jgi:hypothetical protein
MMPSPRSLARAPSTSAHRARGSGPGPTTHRRPSTPHRCCARRRDEGRGRARQHRSGRPGPAARHWPRNEGRRPSPATPYQVVPFAHWNQSAQRGPGPEPPATPSHRRRPADPGTGSRNEGRAEPGNVESGLGDGLVTGERAMRAGAKPRQRRVLGTVLLLQEEAAQQGPGPSAATPGRPSSAGPPPGTRNEGRGRAPATPPADPLTAARNWYAQRGPGPSPGNAAAAATQGPRPRTARNQGRGRAPATPNS